MYTCKGKGGKYELLGIAHGSGPYRTHIPLIIYMDRETGKLYFRDEENFKDRMEEIKCSK